MIVIVEPKKYRFGRVYCPVCDASSLYVERLVRGANDEIRFKCRLCGTEIHYGPKFKRTAHEIRQQPNVIKVIE
jgi:transposase-like protein